MSTQIEIEPVRKKITVESPVDRAFATFTDGIDAWWPADTHSVGAGREDETTETVVFEARQGGRLYERLSNGEECDWGEILVWDPPNRIVLTWHPGYENPAEMTEIDIRFSADGERTLVELVHTGWERLGERGPTTRNGYNEGWDYVLGKFVSGGAA
jgi:uncharacterized protein YndB with AHSA1/START domain